MILEAARGLTHGRAELEEGSSRFRKHRLLTLVEDLSEEVEGLELAIFHLLAESRVQVVIKEVILKIRTTA